VTVGTEQLCAWPPQRQSLPESTRWWQTSPVRSPQSATGGDDDRITRGLVESSRSQTATLQESANDSIDEYGVSVG
jgi:hypothetical protein